MFRLPTLLIQSLIGRWHSSSVFSDLDIPPVGCATTTAVLGIFLLPVCSIRFTEHHLLSAITVSNNDMAKY